VARVQWNRALLGIPEGAILLQRANGSRVMLDPATRTYWRVSMPNLYGLGAARRPVVTRTPVTESAAIVAGIEAAAAAVEITIPFAEARAGMMVSGTPTELPLMGEVWTTGRFPGYLTNRLRPIFGLAFLGLDVAPPGHLVLRQVLRGPLFGDVELESVVTTLSEEEVPDTLFEVPPDYTLVSPPRIGR
jgi:hypothetical protein